MLQPPAEQAAVPSPRWKLPLTALCAGLAIVGVAQWLVAAPPSRPVALPTLAAESKAREVKVHLTGAVVKPGVYTVGDDARVSDVLERAGGPAPGADMGRLNLAQPLKDGQQVVVPKTGESIATGAPTKPAATPRAPAKATTAAVTGAKVNLNTATKAELESLPGIGPATADRILKHRETHGRFANADAFMGARLLPASTWERIKDAVDLP